jgi:hypothetical protein
MPKPGIPWWASAERGGSLAGSGWRMGSIRCTNAPTDRAHQGKSLPVVPDRAKASRVWLGQFLGIGPLGSVDEVERGPLWE